MKKSIIAAILLLLCICVSAQEYTFTGDHYVAKTGGNGDITSLVIDGEDFVRSSYFYFDKNPYEKTMVKEENKLIITCKYGKAVWEFLPDKINLTVDIHDAYNYFLELCSDVKLFNGYEFPVFPLGYPKGEKRFVKNKAALISVGDMKAEAPWEGTIAIDQFVNLKPAHLEETFIPSVTTQEEYNVMHNIESPLNLYSPMNYQVFQRHSKNKGYITFSGYLKNGAENPQYFIEGKDLNDKNVKIGWKKLKSDKFGVFNEKVQVNAGGWYKVQVKYTLNGKEEIKVLDKVGIGEVIIGAGQSNSSNSGQFPTKTETGMVSTTDGKMWKLGNDPMLGVHDGTVNGSFYPALGDALYREFHVPVGMAPTGHAGTNVEAWLPGVSAGGGNENLYTWLMTRVYDFGNHGFRCIVWHQGEANCSSPKDSFYNNMVYLIQSSRKDAGWYIPWFVAKVSYLSIGNEMFENSRYVHQKLWDEGIAFQGPDTDTLGSEYRDYNGEGIHFSPKGLKKHGEMWAEFLIPYIHSQID